MKIKSKYHIITIKKKEKKKEKYLSVPLEAWDNQCHFLLPKIPLFHRPLI